MGGGTVPAKKKAEPLERFTMSKADRELSGNFVSNRGKLPMPITGPYIITSHYGQYAVEGLRNVKLDNKGMIYKGNRVHRPVLFLMEKWLPCSN